MRGPMKFQCSRCQDKFRTESGAQMHIDNHHKKRGGEVLAYVPPPHDDDESFADRAIAAHLDRAMGIPTDDGWLIDY